MDDILEPMQYETGTAIRDFNIIEAIAHADGYDVLLDMGLDSGYELEGVKLKVTFEDLAAYETDDIHQAVRYALGFFDNK